MRERGRFGIAGEEVAEPMGTEKPEIPGDQARDRQRILRCSKCGKSTNITVQEMMEFTATGWPKCCGETMTMFIEAALPGGAKT